MHELERSVGVERSRRDRRAVVAIVVTAASVVAGALAMVAVVAHLPQRTVATVVVEHPAPVIVTVDRPVPIPTAPEPPPPPTTFTPVAEGAACPVIDAAADLPIGVAVDPVKSDADDGATVRVVASTATPRIAVLSDGVVRVSDDDGANWVRAFAGHDVQQIAVARDGTLYAVDGDKVGVRTFPGARDVWRNVPIAVCRDSGECPQCDNRIGVVDDRLVWFHNADLAVSTDRGQHWKPISTADTAWSGSIEGSLFTYRGALYQVEHWTDMCGVDDTPVWRLDRSGHIDHTIFHNYYEEREPVLHAGDDVGTAWRWRERCWGKDADVLTSCSRVIPSVSAMLRVGTLRPVEGARTLAVYERSLIELCDDGARQIYRTFPFDTVDAVDAQGRPLVVRGRDVLRWSPAHGWRRLHRAPSVE